MGSPPRQARHQDDGVSLKWEDDELLSSRTRHRTPRRGSMSPPSRRSSRVMNKQGGPSLMSLTPSINIGIMSLSSSSIQQQVPLFGLAGSEDDNNIENDKSRRRKSKSDKRVSIKESDGRIISSLSATLDDDHLEEQHSLSTNISSATSTTTKSKSPLGQQRLVCRRHTPLLMQEDMPSLTTIGEENQSSSPSSSSPSSSSFGVMLLTTTTPNNGSSPPRKKSHLPKLSPKKESMIMLSPPQPSRRHSRAISDMNFTNDLTTLTPTILYKNAASAGHPMSAGGCSSSTTTRHYHQSPFWSGHVRINPFSPIPEQYLHQSSSLRDEDRSRSSFCNHPGFYNKKLMIHTPLEEDASSTQTSMEVPTLPTTLPHATNSHESRKKTRLIPHRSTSTSSTTSTTSTTTTTDGLRINNNNQEFINSEISPIDVAAQSLIGVDTSSSNMMSCTTKRKATDNDDVLMMMKPPPQSFELVTGDWQHQQQQQQQQQDYGSSINNDKRQRIKQGRYLDDFQEVKFLGSGSFGSVNACLSRLDGCMYAIKTITPTGHQTQTMSSNRTTTAGSSSDIGTSMTTTMMTNTAGGEDDNLLYGGRRRSSKLSILLPPNPRGSPSRRRKSKSRINIDGSLLDMNDNDDNSHNQLDTYLEGSAHWNDGALRRMLREVFALAALCQLDDFRTFHIVRYHQAWLEDNGALYIQTELCTATLRDEMGMMMNGNNFKTNDSISDTTPTTTLLRIDVFRQMKILREILLALELLHQRNMVHLDIKPDNIFRTNDVYKLGDFGLAHASSSTTRNGEQTDIISDVEEGDSRYMSKDLLDFGPKDLTKCDIFSLGLTMYEVCSGQRLPTCGQEWHDIRNGNLCSLLPGTMPCLYGIIREMMHPDPERRPSATDLLSRDALRPTQFDTNFVHGGGSTYNNVEISKSDLARKRSASF